MKTIHQTSTHWLPAFVTLGALGLTPAAVHAQSLYVDVGTGSQSIDKVDLSGNVTPFVSIPGAVSLTGLVVNQSGDVFVVDNTSTGSQIEEVTPGGTPSLFATLPTTSASGLALDSSGNLYASDVADNTIIKITSGGTTSTYASLASGAHPTGLAFDGSDLFVSELGANEIVEVTGLNTVMPFASLPTSPSASNPEGLVVSDGNFFVAEGGSSEITEISSGGVISGTFDPSIGTHSGPEGIAVDTNGNLYVADNGIGDISKISPDGTTVNNTFATGLSGDKFIAFAPAAVPEPSTWAMLVGGLGLLALARARLRLVRR